MQTDRVGSDKVSIRVKNNFNPQKAAKQVRATIGAYADTAAKKMEAEAKKNAPWQDRTGNSRNSIQGDFNWQGNKAIIALSGNVDYFVYLELAMEKRYSILKPTIDRNAPEIIRGYQRLVK